MCGVLGTTTYRREVELSSNIQFAGRHLPFVISRNMGTFLAFRHLRRVRQFSQAIQDQYADAASRENCLGLQQHGRYETCCTST